MRRVLCTLGVLKKPGLHVEEEKKSFRCKKASTIILQFTHFKIVFILQVTKQVSELDLTRARLRSLEQNVDHHHAKSKSSSHSNLSESPGSTVSYCNFLAISLHFH